MCLSGRQENADLQWVELNKWTFLFSDKKFRGWWLLLLFPLGSVMSSWCVSESLSLSFDLIVPSGSKAGGPTSEIQVGNQGEGRKECNASYDCLLYERKEQKLFRNSNHTSIVSQWLECVLHGSPWKSLGRRGGCQNIVFKEIKMWLWGLLWQSNGLKLHLQ